MENECNFNDAKEFFEDLFTPYKREQVEYTQEQVQNLTKLELL